MANKNTSEALKKLYNNITKRNKLFGNSSDNVEFTGQAASDIIKDKIMSDKPLMISRFGSNELSCVLNYYFINQGLLKNIINISSGIPFFMKFKSGIVEHMQLSAGFFSNDIHSLEQFSTMTIKDLSEIDVLGSWKKEEKYLLKFFKKDHVRVHLEDLSPFNHEHPWSVALKGKKVLLVHPFQESILSQYKVREHLFKNPDVLPQFELKTFRSVQTIAGNNTSFTDWFSALDYMTDEIVKIDFDIAILGCGAYGMPLAARIKRMGKQAIHIGGATQCLFGIKGKRWEIPGYNYQERFYNKYWIRPQDSERPANVNKVEDGCYW